MSTFVDICALDDLEPERGVGALLGGTQIAVFRLADGTVRAVQQRDPYSGANVMSRGLVGTHRVTLDDGTERDVDTVTTPMLKQVWDVDTGTPLGALDEGVGWVKTIVFTQGGARLAYGGRDGSIRFWDVPGASVDRRAGGVGVAARPKAG